MAAPSGVALVATGGLAGAACREMVDQALTYRAGTFPLATFLVNIAGAFALGAVVGVLTRRRPGQHVHHPARLLIGTGFLGAFTTYSTFAVDSVQLARAGHAALAAGYVAVTVGAGLAAAVLGTILGRAAADDIPIDPDIDDGVASEAGR